MAYDPDRDEIYVMQTRMDAVQVFKGDADGDVSPVREIYGPKTQIRTVNEAVGRLCLDLENHELYLPNGPKVLVFDQYAQGDVPPKRVLLGPAPHDLEQGPAGGNRGLMYASTCTVDPVHDLLIISGRSLGWGRRLSVYDGVENPNQRDALDGDESVGQLLIFDRTASGDAKPLRVISGSKTLLSYTQMLMTNYPPKGWILLYGVLILQGRRNPRREPWWEFSVSTTTGTSRRAGPSEGRTESSGRPAALRWT
jgi:hypothetical protein